MNNLDLIQLRFPNRLRLSLAEACQMLGISPGTARNRICEKTFGIQTLKDQGRTYVHVQALARHMDDLMEEAGKADDGGAK